MPSASAQTTLVSPTGNGGFENGVDFTSNGWTAANGASSQLTVGILNPPGPSAGLNAAYSTNAGVWNGVNTLNVNHFYRDIAFPPGETLIVLQFKYKVSVVDATFDFLRVFLVPTTTTPVAGTQLGSGQIGANFETALAYANQTLVIPASAAGTTQRLVFQWRTDAANPTSAIAIDEISVVSQSATPICGAYTIDNTLPTGGANFASFTDAINYINLHGICGPLTFNVTAGQAFVETPPVMTATGTAVNPIIFQKTAGTNPVIQPTGGGGTADAGITISGGDYITFDGIDVSRLTGTAMEYGFLVRNLNATDGAQNNTIQNTTISLDRANATSRGSCKPPQPPAAG